MPRRSLTADMLTEALQGHRVSHVSASNPRQFVIHFANGTTLAIESGSVKVKLSPKQPGDQLPAQGGRQPTKRQFEYLAFIAKYIARFGRSPAESDIERHFLVSAPSVNQMMQTLERLGFIARQRGVPRSVRISMELPQSAKRHEAL